MSIIKERKKNSLSTDAFVDRLLDTKVIILNRYWQFTGGQRRNITGSLLVFIVLIVFGYSE